MHDFGYPCSMPREITIDKLFVDDENHPHDYQGLYLFTDPDSTPVGGAGEVMAADRPFPYERCQKVRIRDLSTASGRRAQVSPNVEMQSTLVVEE